MVLFSGRVSSGILSVDEARKLDDLNLSLSFARRGGFPQFKSMCLLKLLKKKIHRLCYI